MPLLNWLFWLIALIVLAVWYVMDKDGKERGGIAIVFIIIVINLVITLMR